MSKQHKVGDVLTFKGYSEELEDPVLTAGDTVHVVEINGDGSFNVAQKKGGEAVETLIDSEVSALKEAKPKKAAAEKTAKQAKGKVVAEEATEEHQEEEVEEKPKKAAKKTAPEKEEVEEEPKEEVKVKKTPSVLKIIKEQGGAIKAAESLIQNVEMTNFTLGGVLAVISQNNEHESLVDEDGEPIYSGFKGFGDFVEHHLGFGYRKAKYLIEIYTTFTALGVTEAQIKNIGWSKLREMTGIVNKDNVHDLIEDAKSMAYDDFRDSIKDRQQDLSGEGDKVKMKTFKFRLHADQSEVAETAISMAMEAAGISADEPNAVGLAIHHIMTEWMALQQG